MGAEGEEREVRLVGLRGVLAAGQGSPGITGVPVSSTVSRLSCRERSADEESNTEFITDDSSVTGPVPDKGAGL